jgi:hypothetical protein
VSKSVRLDADRELLVGDEAAWPDLHAATEPKRPRLEPGVYWGRSAHLDTFERAGWRRRVRIWFEILSGHPLEGETHVLATLPWYATIPAGRRPTISASSKLSRLFDLLGPADPRRDPTRRADRVPLRALRHRLWRLAVEDVTSDGQQRPLHREQWYSIVKAVLEHVA